MSTYSLEASDETTHTERQRKSEFVINLGLWFNALLAMAKLTAGIIGHSQALVADGVNSVSDVAYFLVVKIFVSLSGKPADSEHPYGHYQYETIAALVVGAFVIVTGFAIFWDSVNEAYDLFAGKRAVVAVQSFALYTAIATILIKILLRLHARGIWKATKNLAVLAIARDHRNDIFASLGAATGIVLAMMGIGWADPIAGAIVAVIVAKTGFSILREATDELMDSVPGEDLSEQIKAILQDEERILRIDEIHSHRFGPYLIANITICIDGSMTVAEADEIATSVETKMLNSIDMLRRVYVHAHPLSACGIEKPN